MLESIGGKDELSSLSRELSANWDFATIYIYHYSDFPVLDQALYVIGEMYQLYGADMDASRS